MRRVTGPQIEMVRPVLNKWDPIGVSQYVADEYDAYIADVVSLLLDGRSRDEIAAYLYRLGTEQIGLSGDQDRCLAAADKLLALDLPTEEY
ncbi:hypothetical protein K2D_14130 [Planctomycetes bacterium K2D]|uniref:DUF1871 domain-containing protein n=2 Tax=Botrimarina mediterranea TaxID=2528022 RepID=A0A518K678_9BACT|nr:hypothetical protein Spa11_14870 [Botrimarina mediterranea]QDV77808.1 hypothetical protein K2D_14130 [Planctomycetes bacterium K2D]